jgi:hypothetical protein
MSCKLIDFYNKVIATQKNPQAQYQEDCYDFVPQMESNKKLIARINAFSPNFYVENETIPYSKNTTWYYTNPGDECAINPDTVGGYDTNYILQKPFEPTCEENDEGSFTLARKNIFTEHYEKQYIGTELAWLVGDTESICTKLYNDDSTVQIRDSTSFPPYTCKGESCTWYSKITDSSCELSYKERNLISKSTPYINYDTGFLNLSEDDPNIICLYNLVNGLITMEFFQDQSPLLNQGSFQNLSDSQSFRTNLITGQSDRIQKINLPISFSYPFYIYSGFVAIISIFYTQIYTNYQLENFNDFANTSFIGKGSRFPNYVQSLINKVFRSSDKVPFQDALQDVDFYMENICLFPSIAKSSDGKSFTIRVYFNQSQYDVLDALQDNQRLSSLKDYLTILLDDGSNKNVSYYNRQSKTALTDVPFAEYSDLMWDERNIQILYFDYSDFNVKTETVLPYLKTQSLQDFQNDTNGKVLLSFSAEMTIKSWSPMLYIYSKVNCDQPKQVDFDFANTLYQDVGMYPNYENFGKDICGNQNYFSCYTNACVLQFLPSTVKCTSNASEVFVSSSEECNCIASNSMPNNVSPRYANKEAMCYSKTCSQDTLDLFSIPENYCQSTCPDITNWVNNKEIPIMNPKNFDQEKYQKLCTTSSTMSFNIYYFLFILSGCAYVLTILCQKLFSQKKNKIIFLMSTGIPLLILSIFLGFFFAGQSVCGEKDNREIVCYSNVIKTTRLPLSCCGNDLVNCECIINSDCQDANQGCEAGICTPFSADDSKKVSTPIIPIADFILFGINFVLFLTMLFLTIKISRLNKGILIAFLSGIYGIFFVLLYYLYWTQEKTSYKK